MGWWLGAKQFIKNCDEAEKLAFEAQRQYNLIMNGVGKMGIKFRSKEGTIYEVNDPPVHRLFTAQDIYNSRMKSRGDEVVSLFGYSAEEILKIINAHELGKVKMTRGKTIKSIQGYLGCPYDHASAMANMFEALGLIKFDDDKKDDSGFEPSMLRGVHEFEFDGGSMILGSLKLKTCDAIVNFIYRNGYKIVKA